MTNEIEDHLAAFLESADADAPAAEATGATSDSATANSIDALPVRHELYQGVRCGNHLIAISYQWARSIAETFDEVPIPKAPIWLAGAAAIESQIRPVIDLALFIDPAYQRDTTLRSARLLVGGRDDGDLFDPPLALLFDGLPQQLSSEHTATATLAPPAIASMVSHSVRNAVGETFHVIDMAKFAAVAAAELSLI
jgi:hypothetical protein